jgi:hypothetical protein
MILKKQMINFCNLVLCYIRIIEYRKWSLKFYLLKTSPWTPHNRSITQNNLIVIHRKWRLTLDLEGLNWLIFTKMDKKIQIIGNKKYILVNRFSKIRSINNRYQRNILPLWNWITLKMLNKKIYQQKKANKE